MMENIAIWNGIDHHNSLLYFLINCCLVPLDTMTLYGLMLTENYLVCADEICVDACAPVIYHPQIILFFYLQVTRASTTLQVLL